MSCACSRITIPSLLASSSSSTHSSLCATLTLLLSLVDWVLSSMCLFPDHHSIFIGTFFFALKFLFMSYNHLTIVSY
jgi:hypothetical protein